MDAVLGPSTTAAALNLWTYNYFKLFVPLVFQSQLSWAIFIDQVKTLTHGFVEIVHEYRRWIIPVRFGSWHLKY